MQFLSCQRSRTTILLAVFSAIIFVSLLRLSHSHEYFHNNPNIEITPDSHHSQYQSQSQSQSQFQLEQPPNGQPQPETKPEAQAPSQNELNFNSQKESRPQPRPPPHPQSQPIPKPDPVSKLLQNYECNLNLDLLRPHGSYGEGQVRYSRWDIAVVRSEKFKGYSENLNVPLPDSEAPPLQLDLNTGDPTIQYRPLRPKTCKPIVIEAPPVDQVDASHIYVGFATTIERLHDDLPAFAHWAANNNLHMFGLLEEITIEEDLGDGNGTQTRVIDRTPELREMEARARELGIRMTLQTSSAEYTDRYFALTKVMWENRDLDAKTEWAVVIDDDTFFPSMGNIVRKLKAAYDPSEKWYIGAPTESFEQLKGNMWMAFGGAGIFMSMPLIEEMMDYFDECDLWKGPGDQKIAQCVYWHTKTKLTWDRGLFQLDIHRDPSGFFESGRPLPLSVHHWKSNFHLDMVALSKVAAICGDNCLLNRWRVGDSREWFFTNGFSLVKYSSPLSDEEMERMEFTWEEDYWSPMDDYNFSLAPLREMDWEKFSFQLQDAVVENDGHRVRQIYVHEPDFFDDGPPQIREVVWNLVDDQ